MKRLGIFKILFCLVLAVLFSGGTAWAGGIMLYQFGSPDVGYGNAGYAARAQDASTVFTNPAGMSRLESSQSLIASQALYAKVKFSPNELTNVAGGTDGGNAIGWTPGGSLFLVHKINQDWSFGFGALSYFGLSQGFDGDWVGRYYIQKSTLVGMTFMPAVSYRVNDWLSIGAGLNMMYGYLKNQVAINNGAPVLSDGQMNYKDTVLGYGANLGVLFEPKKGTRFGLTYLSEVKLDFSDVPEFSGLSNPVLLSWLESHGFTTGSLDLGMTVPQMVMFSAYHELNSKWAVLGNIGWQDWSRFGKVDVAINSNDPTSLTVDSHYKDTWHAALGSQYTYSPAWRFSFGICYDSSAVSDEDRTVSVPIGEVKAFAFGAQYALSQNLTLGAAYQFAWLGDMPVDQNNGPLTGRVAGEFANTTFQFFALNMIWVY